MGNWDIEIKKIVDKAKKLQKGYAKEWIESIKSHEMICIFGAGEHGGCWYHILEQWGIEVNCFCDNNDQKWNQNIINQTKCIAPDELKKINKNVAVIVALKTSEDVISQIKNWNNTNIDIYIGSLNKVSYITNYEYIGDIQKLENLCLKIIKVLQLCEDERSKEICYQTVYKWLLDENYPIKLDGDAYFYTQKLPLTKEESLVDIGAYNGDTIENFLSVTSGQFNKIYAFEMDKTNYTALKENVNSKENIDVNKIELFQLGISDQQGKAYYKSSFQTSEISNIGTEVCNIDRLDNILKDKSVTMIKMDIEGAEKKALKGAETIIKEQKPKLAICIYHSIGDFLDIPVYLKGLNPEYKIFLRHHSTDDSETVCYAY